MKSAAADHLQMSQMDTARPQGIITGALRQHATLLEGGVLISIDEARTRARILPLRR